MNIHNFETHTYKLTKNDNCLCTGLNITHCWKRRMKYHIYSSVNQGCRETYQKFIYQWENFRPTFSTQQLHDSNHTVGQTQPLKYTRDPQGIPGNYVEEEKTESETTLQSIEPVPSTDDSVNRSSSWKVIDCFLALAPLKIKLCKIESMHFPLYFTSLIG